MICVILNFFICHRVFLVIHVKEPHKTCYYFKFIKAELCQNEKYALLFSF